MNAPNINPMMIIWIRGSSLIFVNIRLITPIPPEYFRVFMIRIAPKMITIVSMDVRKPDTVCAAIVTMSIFHAKKQTTAVINHANGRAIFAGQLKPAITIIVTIIGIKAIIAYML